jgi:hypothetical protein
MYLSSHCSVVVVCASAVATARHVAAGETGHGDLCVEVDDLCEDEGLGVQAVGAHDVFPAHPRRSHEVGHLNVNVHNQSITVVALQ